jgi:hypothetical protein
MRTFREGEGGEQEAIVGRKDRVARGSVPHMQTLHTWLLVGVCGTPGLRDLASPASSPAESHKRWHADWSGVEECVYY